MGIKHSVDKIAFNRSPVLGTEIEVIRNVLNQGNLGGGGVLSQQCEDYFNRVLGAEKTFLTPSCTAALEMAALIAGISEGDEVIMPSFTFVSTANAFALRRARIVFVDIRPDTMNLDETLLEKAITDRTRAIVPVHYNGVGCEMDAILEIARQHDLVVIEDAAQAVGARYRGRPLGTIGHIGTYSFDQMKNITTGEGGLIIINDPKMAETAQILRDKGTNRSQFLRGMVEKYHWCDVGSNYSLSELSAAFLWAQLGQFDEILLRRRAQHARYCDAFVPLVEAERVELQLIPEHCQHNGHIFYLKVADREERASLIDYLAKRGVTAAFHYVPLHSSPAGKRFGRFSGEDRYTSRESSRLLRLPIYLDLTDEEQSLIISLVLDFFVDTN